MGYGDGRERDAAHSAIRCRDLAPGEEQQVLALVIRGFDELVRPDFSDEGIDEFIRAARAFVLGHPNGHRITVTEDEGTITGMIDVRDSSHVALFFVEAGERGQGIGGALLATAIGDRGAGVPATSTISVNSSPWAVPVYERLGFVATGPEIERNGIRAVPMARPV